MKPVRFSGKAYLEYIEWSENDRDTFEKIGNLLKEISRDPFRGIGKPEPLKGNLRGWWSRRINQEHRLVYRIENNELWINSLKGHYND